MIKAIFLIVIFLAFNNNIFCKQILFINELMAKNDSFVKDDNGNYSDWIEIYNSSEQQINLSGYYLSDDNDTLNKWIIPEGNIIGAYGYYIFWCDGNPDSGKRHTNFKLSANGENLYLVDKDGKTIIDSVKFGVQEADISYGRIEDGNHQWVFFERPTFASRNYKENSSKLPVLINEFMASNSKTIQDETGAFPDWIEFYNNSDKEIDISGLYLTDKPYREPTQWRIPTGTRITPRGFLLIWADNDVEDGPLHANFKLSTDGDSIAIYAKDGKTLIDLIAFGKQSEDISYGRKYDASPEWITILKPTPGASNGPVSVENLIQPEMLIMKLMPNPTNDFLDVNLLLNLSGRVILKIYNYNGKELLIEDKGYCGIGEHRFKLDISNLSAGSYICQLLINNHSFIKKIIIE